MNRINHSGQVDRFYIVDTGWAYDIHHRSDNSFVVGLSYDSNPTEQGKESCFAAMLETAQVLSTITDDELYGQGVRLTPDTFPLMFAFTASN